VTRCPTTLSTASAMSPLNSALMTPAMYSLMA
jgi:hypothetical protein